MTRALVLAAVLAVCGPSAWAQDCAYCTGDGIEHPCNQTVAIPWTASFSDGHASNSPSPTPWPIGSFLPQITVNGVTITYPASDTATVNADGSVTIGRK